ncbi:serine hydrolase [Vagococcus sp.]|uniref:serine hydrolase n=1 Tax=Vagococcus sp. TaxID=1933889 RepID=UPI003F9E25B7
MRGKRMRLFFLSVVIFCFSQFDIAVKAEENSSENTSSLLQTLENTTMETSLTAESSTLSSSETTTETESEKRIEVEVENRLENFEKETYATVLKKDFPMWKDFDKEKTGTTSDWYQQTLYAKERLVHQEKNYIGLYQASAIFIGYVEESALALTNQPEGMALNFDRYMSKFTSENKVYLNFDEKDKISLKELANQTLHARQKFNHSNGKSYLSLFNRQNELIGYVHEEKAEFAAGPQGHYLSFGKYVTVTNENHHSFNDFKGNLRNNTGQLFGKTLKAQGKYYHFDGKVYFSLYDYQGKWQGYMTEDDLNSVTGPQGVYQPLNRYVTVTNGNYTTWSNFSWKAKGKSQAFKNKTLLVKGMYRHFNGPLYYSLYDGKGKWQGYINAQATQLTTGAQGSYQPFWKEVKITNKNYQFWQGFDWQSKGKTSEVYQRVLMARGKYQHFNGSIYYSVYDNKGKWYGYLNTGATMIYTGQAEKMKKVQTLLNQRYSSSNLGVYIVSLEDGSSASRYSTRQMTAASTGKLPAMYYTQKMINEKRLNPYQKFRYTNAINQMPLSYQSGGAGIMQGKAFGGYYSIDQVMNWTAKYSDNQGANFLAYYGAGKYNATMRQEISGVIGRQWQSPFLISPKENGLLMRKMYQQGGRVMGYLQNTVFDQQRIPKYLPVQVAHKIGDVGHYRHDVGVVYSKSPYVISVMTKNNTSYEVISNLSRDVYQILK